MSRTLTIEAGATILPVARWSFAPEARAVQNELYRSPYGTAWFTAGDGKDDPAPLALDVRIEGTTIDASIAALTELIETSLIADTVRWGEFRRTVNGLTGFTKSPTVMGYRVRLEFAATSRVWLDTLDNEVWL